MTSTYVKMISGLATGIAVLAIGTSTALASTTAPTAVSSFDTQYQSNATTEATLFKQAQVVASTNTTVNALLSTATTLNTEAASLYTSEQLLVNAKTAIPQVTVTIQPTPKGDKPHRGKGKKNDVVKMMFKAHGKDAKFFADADDKTQDNQTQVPTNTRPYDGGLKAVREAILRLQMASMFYTKEAIAIETTPTTTTTNVTITSNSTN